jgi:pimeloyl-ACP methyl ester carboxylesterase
VVPERVVTQAQYKPDLGRVPWTRWREYATNVRAEAIPDCGHFLPEEQPDALAERITQFLGGG